MFLRSWILACTMAALITIGHSATTTQPTTPQAAPNSLISPCPELFHYEAVDKPGQWTGSLILRSDFDIKGVWIRLIFDKEVKDVTVDSDFEIKKEKKTALVQGKDVLLDAGIPKILKITVTYDGTEAPSLIEYRLNARTICPQANIHRQDVFLGDTKSNYFLSSLKVRSEFPQPSTYKCGIPHPSNPHPWQAAIYIHRVKEEQYTCEATLISPNYIITAAHCVTFQKERTVIPRAFISVYLGPDGASKNAIRSLVSDILVHPGYDAGSLLDDVALLKLATPIEVNDVVRPICLRVRGDNATKAILIGHEIGADGHIGNLLESQILLNDLDKCMKLAPHLKGTLAYETYCISYQPGDKYCVGNSGSGLITTDSEGVATLEGIVVLGIRLQNQNTCGSQSVAVVTELQRYYSSIKNIIY